MKLRSFVIAVSLLVTAAVYASAQTRATFIMTNGQRVSGELVHHGGQGNNMIDDQLNLGNAGKEQSYPADQVAVIDIAGGTPSQKELDTALQSQQAMALRNGFVQGGQFVNIQNGTTLVWRNESGQEQRYGLHDVARIYLNTGSARGLFNVNTAPPAAAPVATSGQSAPAVNSVRRGGAIEVNGKQPWTNTGIQVRAGDMVSFRVTGQVTVAEGVPPVGPEGKTGETSPKYPIPSMQDGALIGRVNNGAPFPIGSETAPIRMTSDGTLMLGINDDYFNDNGGAFLVTVQVNGRRR